MTGRLIDADKVQHDICELYKIYGDGMCSLEFIAHMINSVPTVEAIPIEWLESHYPPAVNHDSVAYITKATVVEELIREYRSERKDA